MFAYDGRATFNPFGPCSALVQFRLLLLVLHLIKFSIPASIVVIITILKTAKEASTIPAPTGTPHLPHHRNVPERSEHLSLL